MQIAKMQIGLGGGLTVGAQRERGASRRGSMLWDTRGTPARNGTVQRSLRGPLRYAESYILLYTICG